MRTGQLSAQPLSTSISLSEILLVRVALLLSKTTSKHGLTSVCTWARSITRLLLWKAGAEKALSHRASATSCSCGQYGGCHKAYEPQTLLGGNVLGSVRGCGSKKEGDQAGGVSIHQKKYSPRRAILCCRGGGHGGMSPSRDTMVLLHPPVEVVMYSRRFFIRSGRFQMPVNFL
jgi:hypothetical protein